MHVDGEAPCNSVDACLDARHGNTTSTVGDESDSAAPGQ